MLRPANVGSWLSLADPLPQGGVGTASLSGEAKAFEDLSEGLGLGNSCNQLVLGVAPSLALD
jgi:hypothetical protein